jgi:hypothetical protein
MFKNELNMRSLAEELLFIEGWGGSGKSVLSSLLDSHPNLFCSPVHDKLQYQLMQWNGNSEGIFDIRDIRYFLASHGYYNIEANALRGSIPVLLSSKKEDALEVPFNFDFEKFETIWKGRVNRENKLTSNKIINAIYLSFRDSIRITHLENIKYNCTMGDARFHNVKRLLDKYPGSKIIYVKRSFEQVVATRIARKSPVGFPVSMFNKKFIDVILNAEIFELAAYEKNFNEMQFKYPDRMMTIAFDDLVMDTNNIMIGISNFLGVDFRESMLTPTLLNVELKNERVSYIGQVNDNSEDYLSSSQIIIIKMFKFIASINVNLSLFFVKVIKKVNYIRLYFIKKSKS